MKFTAVVDKILPHERLVGTGVRETYKNVIHLVVTDKNGVIAAQQPQSEIAGTMELHIPADVEWDEVQPGLLVNVDLTVKKPKEAPSKSTATTSAKRPSRPGSGKSKPRRSTTSKPRAKSSGSRAKTAKRAPSDLTSPTTAP